MKDVVGLSHESCLNRLNTVHIDQLIWPPAIKTTRSRLTRRRQRPAICHACSRPLCSIVSLTFPFHLSLWGLVLSCQNDVTSLYVKNVIVTATLIRGDNFVVLNSVALQQFHSGSNFLSTILANTDFPQKFHCLLIFKLSILNLFYLIK